MALSIIALASKQHHESAHERTNEERQKRQDRVGVHRSRRDEEPDENGNAEEDEQCFARAAPHKAKGKLEGSRGSDTGNSGIGDAVLRRRFPAFGTCSGIEAGVIRHLLQLLENLLIRGAIT